ncbi:hypothetical protein D918_08713 [Trichuris suis]|nr:hypothetical protein D918_08713 [Trichuris suis]
MVPILSSRLSASPEGRSDMPGVISTFDAISPRLLHSSRLKATELLTTPFVPKLELHNLADEPEKDGVALLNAEATPRLGDDSYANLTQTPLVSSSKEAVRAIARVSVDCLLKQLATGQSLWKTPKAAELYFVACELSNHRRGNSDQFDHLFRDFIFDLCRDFVANIYGCEEKADCIGQAGCRYALSSQVIKGNDEMVKRLVDLLVLQSIFSSSRHARIDVVARRSWDDVDNRILSEMYEQDAVFFNLNAVEEEVRNASADVIVSHQMPITSSVAQNDCVKRVVQILFFCMKRLKINLYLHEYTKVEIRLTELIAMEDISSDNPKVMRLEFSMLDLRIVKVA